MNHKMLRRALVVVVAVGMLAGCGERGPENGPHQLSAAESSQGTSDGAELLNTERLDPEAMEALQVAAFDLSGDPQLPIASRGKGYDLMVLGRVIAFRKGPAPADMPAGGDSGDVVIEVQTDRVVTGDEKAGSSLYVHVYGVGLETLREAVPPGTAALISAYHVSGRDDPYVDDPWSGFAEGATRYEAGPLEFAVADGPEHTWLPQLKKSFDRPLTDGIPPELADKLAQR